MVPGITFLSTCNTACSCGGVVLSQTTTIARWGHPGMGSGVTVSTLHSTCKVRFVISRDPKKKRVLSEMFGIRCGRVGLWERDLVSFAVAFGLGEIAVVVVVRA